MMLQVAEYCSNGKQTPLQSYFYDCDEGEYPVTSDEATCCITGGDGKCIDYHDYTEPTIDSAFRLPDTDFFYTSETMPEDDCSGDDMQTVVNFSSGTTLQTETPNLDEPYTGYMVMCVRSTE